MKNLDIITVLGIISLAYWLFDVINNIFFLHEAVWSLWFSSVGIGLTAIGLLTRNTFLLSSLFCALFVVEMSWNIGFFSHVLFHKSFMGMTDYLFIGSYTMKDFLITSYHVVMLPFLLAAIIREKAVHKMAWIGAAVFSAGVLTLTYFFAGPRDTINCVHTLDNCKAFLFFLDHISNPMRTILGIAVMTIVVYIPTNYLLIKLIKTQEDINYKSKITHSQ
jgi:hypothetical protein